MEFLGRHGSLTLFSSNESWAVVDESINAVASTGPLPAAHPTGYWNKMGASPKDQSYELANAAMTTLNITVIPTSDRMHTIPKAVQTEASRALDWFSKHGRGGTPVGLHVARTLAAGGQIGVRQVRHIAQYFPRHTADTLATGYMPRDAGYPSKGRIGWGLWGGQAAQKWAFAIVERENKKHNLSLVAANGYYDHEEPEPVVLQSFDKNGSEFIARVREDGSGIDRLYQVEANGQVYVWDDGCWDTLGHINHDIDTYDKSLDDPYDTVAKEHVAVDRETALTLAALLDAQPFMPKSLTDLEPDEMELFAAAESEIDWDEVDSITAAGDGNYTPEERADNASSQVRDAKGRFAETGSRVIIGGNPQNAGKITSINPRTKAAAVKMDDGKTITVPVSATQKEDDTAPPTPAQAAEDAPVTESKVDVKGILAEPREEINKAKAVLPEKMPILGQDDVKDLFAGYPARVREYRAKKGKSVTAAATPEDHEGDVTGPEKSDVPALYMAVVADDDPQAVMDLVALVPANAKSTTPVAFTRKPGAWERDDEIISDLNSPTPPPVVMLDETTLKEVMGQIDSAVTAAGVALTLSGAVFSDTFISANATDSPASLGYIEVLSVMTASGTSSQRPTHVLLSRADIQMLNVNTRTDSTQMVNRQAFGDGTYSQDVNGSVGHDVFSVERSDTISARVDVPLPDKVAIDLSGSGQDAFQISGKWWQGPVVQRPVIASDTEPAGVDRYTNVAGSSVDHPVIVLHPGVAVVAAGGLDRNRGNAEKLRRYWLYGAGAAKIRWNTGGDWKRCVKHLAKYMGPRAKGYCALRHKEATGMWTGDTAHRAIYGRTASGEPVYSDSYIASSEDVVRAAELRVQAFLARSRVLTASASDAADRLREFLDSDNDDMLRFLTAKGVLDRAITAGGSSEELGAPFFIKLVIPEGIESGDGRQFERGSLTMRKLPLPLLWQIKTAGGHDGSVVVGKITEMERTEEGIGNARGFFDTGEYGREAERLVRLGFFRGISADLDKFEAEAEVEDGEVNENGEPEKIETGRITAKKGRVMAATLVAKPAFEECEIALEDSNQQEEDVVPDGVYVEDVDAMEASALVACGIVAGVIPAVPPSEWFDNPRLKNATPLTVGDDGRVYGHVAAWHVDHIGMSFGTRPPKSRSKYAYFHTGVVRTEEGTDVPVGQLTLAGGHASLEASAQEAVRHYDDTASAIADVHAGEDSYGIWVAGALRPGTTPEQIRALRASAPSGDWRPIKGHLELVAVLQVNVPGFPIARARVASGQVMALVAAGASTLARMKSDPIADITSRMERLEREQQMPVLAAAAQEAESRIASTRAAVLVKRHQDLMARVRQSPDQN